MRGWSSSSKIGVVANGTEQWSFANLPHNSDAALGPAQADSGFEMRAHASSGQFFIIVPDGEDTHYFNTQV